MNGLDSEAEKVVSSKTTPYDLCRIAEERPDLRHHILAHPNCYPALEKWIRAKQMGDSSVGNEAPMPALTFKNMFLLFLLVAFIFLVAFGMWRVNESNSAFLFEGMERQWQGPKMAGLAIL